MWKLDYCPFCRTSCDSYNLVPWVPILISWKYMDTLQLLSFHHLKWFLLWVTELCLLVCWLFTPAYITGFYWLNWMLQFSQAFHHLVIIMSSMAPKLLPNYFFSLENLLFQQTLSLKKQIANFLIKAFQALCLFQLSSAIVAWKHP